MHTFRRHNPAKCKFTTREERRCKCPIWVVGRDREGLFVRKPLHKFLKQSSFIRDWTKAQEDLRLYEFGETKPQAKTAISEWRDKYLNDCEARNLGESTVRKYKLLFSQLEAFAKIKGISFADKIRLDDLTEFRSTWADNPLSSSKKLERLRSIYKFALKRKWVESNLAEDIKSPTVEHNPTLPFSDEEMKRILTSAKESKEYAAHSTYVFILVMRYSGLRISDVTTLPKAAVQQRRLRLYTAKTGEPVSMLLPEFVVAELSKVSSTHPKNFFWTGNSKTQAAASMWRKRIAKVFKAAGIVDGHTHRFRDTFAVSLLSSGVSMQDVSTLLGHASIKITQKHYAPWDKTRQDALDKVLANLEISIPA
jgi:integrase/recombinase XerD